MHLFRHPLDEVIMGQTLAFTLDRGPYLAHSAIDIVHDACIIPILQPTHSGLFPPQTHVGKLANTLAPPGAVQRKEEACSGANVFCRFRKQFRH